VTTMAVLDRPAVTRPAPGPGFGDVLRSERIKFFSTRSPWWCTALAAVLAIGFGLLVTGSAAPGENRIYFTMAGMQFALVLVLVMAAIAISSEYRFGTIRTTFQTTASRTKVLWTKAALVGGLALVLGEVLAFATFFVARLVAKDDVLQLSSGTDWRMVAGHGLVFGSGALIGVGVGAIVRQTAGAISLLLVWTLLVENLVQLIPNVGQDIARLLPFNNATLFAGDREVSGVLDPVSTVASLGIFVGTALLIMIAATVVVRRRDA
jgi:ABC-2 type transport system permease protein